MTETGLIVFLILALVGQAFLFCLHIQTLTNKIMSRDYAEYQTVKNSARIETVHQPQQLNPEMPEDLRGLAGIG